MADRVCRQKKCNKKNRAISSDACVDHYILLLKEFSNHIAFYNKRLQTLFKDSTLLPSVLVYEEYM